MKKKKNYNEFPPETDGDMETAGGAASASDCTGLIPAGNAGSAGIYDNYNDICSFSADDKQKDIRKNKRKKNG